jgi:hypothetical protein
MLPHIILALHPLCIIYIIYILIHIGSAERVTLLEFKLEGEKTPRRSHSMRFPKEKDRLRRSLLSVLITTP